MTVPNYKSKVVSAEEAVKVIKIRVALNTS